ncbi:MAG: ABC transporter ATP-binding protein [Verrucomicrobia bacterium]|nr:ABC transporter ATP-binding protein [Verrucomicrobiota bacterium]
MNEPDLLVELENVSVPGSPWFDVGLSDVSFRLRPGDWIAVRLEPGATHCPLADAIAGLIPVEQGRLRYLGKAWEEVSSREADRMRSTLGRVFEQTNWISNLDIDENILLSQRYHTQRPESEIREEADRLARNFGFDQLPGIRPAHLTTSDLVRLSWVRALLGSPRLLLLERPARECTPVWRDRLMTEVAAACARGAAALWLTDDPATWAGLQHKAVLLFALNDSTMTPVPKP